MGMAIDGLISGLKTTDLIDSLMQAEAIPQTLLKNKVTDSTNFISAMQALNSKVAALADSAGKLAKPAGTDLHTTSSSSTAVTATAGPGAVDGSIDFTVASKNSHRCASCGRTSFMPFTPESFPAFFFCSVI